MLIAAGEAVLHPNRDIDTRSLGRGKHIDGNTIPAGFSFAGVRLASGVFAVLGAMAFFGLMYAITESTFTALVFSNLFTFENAFITQFRAAHLDAFQIAFTIVALLCFVVAVRRGQRSSPLLEAGLGAACGLAMMVKLNALVLLLLPAMLIGRRVITAWAKVPGSDLQWVARTHILLIGIRDAAVVAAGCVLVMIAVFVVHIRISTKDLDPTSTAGQKDQRFLSEDYREYLQGKRPLSAGVLLSAASNRVSWILAFAAPFAVFALLMLQWLRPVEESDPGRRALMCMLLLEYAAFMALHWFLGTQRVMYLYHYFIGLIVAFTMLPLLLQEVINRWPAARQWQTPALAGLTFAVLASFVFHSPLNFHRPLTHDECERRNTLQHVVDCHS
jgi:dolichyl-phosphate-mannose-protein mannosyltransferase